MAKHALPRALFKLVSEDRGRGRSKRDADQLLLDVYEQLRDDHQRLFKKRFSARAFLRLWMIEQHVGSGLSRVQAEDLLDHPSEADRVKFEAHCKTLSNRLAKARQQRKLMQRRG